ncbi:hypothetical protein [Mycolicibacterium sp. 120270]|uniref:hypothetical protein n=1 Tax=Mycolicibacterium sp. 120270 TaxID=3090600 RepID=UPI00299E6996|nr:hypothetical protein [Mycolicibacterium sp. 120270]MDX1883051.1 hypothetical protein [Mycolicibacterium sp. 120270]
MTDTTVCGLNGCTNPTDPDSGIGRCMDCTLVWELEVVRIGDVERQRKAAKTRRASVDAVLLAQAFHRGDNAAGQAVADNCDVWSVLVQTFGFLFATLRQFDVDVEDRLAIWLEATRAEIGEPS